MERWVKKKQKHLEVPDVDAFLAEIVAVCRKHKLSLLHQDPQGAFVVDQYDERWTEWLMDANDYRGSK
jgi:hypothetical protein